jgi:hypothetical protein
MGGGWAGDGRGAHWLTIREAGRALGPELRAVIAIVDSARVSRNRTEYDAQPVSQAQLEALQQATSAVLVAVREFIEGKCP